MDADHLVLLSFIRGWISIAPAVGGQFFNLVYGSLYDREARHEHTLECFGRDCFHYSFVLGTCSSFLGALVLTYLLILTRRNSRQ